MCQTAVREGATAESKGGEVRKHEDPQIGWVVAILTYLSYAMVITFGYLRDLFASITGISRYAVSES